MATFSILSMKKNLGVYFYPILNFGNKQLYLICYFVYIVILFIQNDSVVIVDTSEEEELSLEEIEDEEDVPDLPEEMKPYCTGKQIYWAVEGHEEEEHNNGEGGFIE